MDYLYTKLALANRREVDMSESMRGRLLGRLHKRMRPTKRDKRRRQASVAMSVIGCSENTVMQLSDAKNCIHSSQLELDSIFSRAGKKRRHRTYQSKKISPTTAVTTHRVRAGSNLNLILSL
jgi:hypothetical protein